MNRKSHGRRSPPVPRGAPPIKMQPFHFGQPQQQAQPFGSGGTSTFGGFGGGFGQTTTQPQQQGFGSTFGAPAVATSTAPPGFGTGSTFGASGGGFGGGSTFGTPQPAGGTTGGLFGTPAPSVGFGGGTTVTSFGAATSQPSTGFGGGGFGGASSFGSGTGGLFGSSQAQPTSTFGTGQTFGTQPTGTFGSSLASFQPATQQPSLFSSTQQTGGFGSTQPSALGTTTTQSGSWFGASQPQTSTFGGFGTGSGGLFSQQKPGYSFPTWGQPQQNQQVLQQQQPVDDQGAFYNSIFGCCKYGDERDSILANLNYIQASWGAGKGYFNQGNVPVMYNDKNVFCRFNTVGYSYMYDDSNESGQVVLQIKKPHSTVCKEETQLITSLQNMIAKPNIFYRIAGSKALNEDVTVIIITADDRSSLRRIPATDLSSVLLQPQLRSQLESLGIISVSPKVKPSPEQLKAYLDSPPAGLDPRVWKKAQEDNPDSVNMIPIPLLGPEALKMRMESQQKENHQHAERLRIITDEVTNIQNRHAIMQTEIKQLKQKSAFITHRIISICVRILIVQKQGLPLQPEEEELRKQLGEMVNQLNSPTHFRGRLNELMSHIRMQKTALEARSVAKHSVDGQTLDQVKDFLSLQQCSITHLVDTLKACIEFVQKMNDDMSEFHEKSPPT